MANERIPWTESRIVGSPEPPHPYAVERIFPEIQFENPVDFALDPESGHWFILQLDGKLLAFDPESAQPPRLVYDVKQQIEGHDHSYGVTFHPRYSENRQVFMTYTVPKKNPNGTRVSRFVMREVDGDWQLDPASEEIILTWPSGGHNGACLRFGPDGLLYITTGDGTGPFPPDAANVGQDLSDLRSTILRIDVDHAGAGADNKLYRVPADNPFLEHPGAQPEIWAFGFRNPWKISFDAKTGELWCGDVGWELWEMIFNIQRGGNYGWSIKEGPQPVRNDLPQGPGEIIPAVAEHFHTEAASITGGEVYYGSRFPELVGKYIYGDWVTGKIWGLQNNGNRLTSLTELADSRMAIITFGSDSHGELVIVDYAGGLYRLIPNPQPDTSEQFPRRLSETGLFSSLAPHLIPAAGVYGYALNTKMWQDGANASYLLAIPEEGSIVWNANPNRWGYPENTVFAKTLTRWTVVDNVLKHRKIETQILHYDGKQWQPYSYLWNDDETDAELVAAAGTSRPLHVPRTLPDANSQSSDAEEVALSTLDQIEWRVHSRSECGTCHMSTAGDILGFDVANLNRASHLPDAHQLDLLAELKLFDRKIPAMHRMTRMWSLDEADETASADSADGIDVHARSYLAINCAHCHRRNGGGTAPIEFPFSHNLSRTNAVDALPTQGSFEIGQARIIAPGKPEESVLYYRLATVGRGRMPHLGARDVDEAGLQLIANWIRQLGTEAESTATPTPDLTTLFEQILAGGEINPEVIAAQLGSTSQALRTAEQLALQSSEQSTRATLARPFVQAAPPHLRGLFERFLPISERVQTLGERVNPEEIVHLPGDPAAGARLFREGVGISCRNCHQVGDVGKGIGPDLTRIGSQRTRAELLESILFPSRKIDPKYALRTALLSSGRVVSGILAEETDEQLILIDAAGERHVLKRDDIEEFVTQPRSLMPDLLTKEMTAQELADLLDFLAAQRE